MKYSIIMAVTILMVFFLFTILQQKKRGILTAEYTETESRAEQLGVPTDPNIRLNSKSTQVQRAQARNAQISRDQEIQSCLDDLISCRNRDHERREQGKFDFGKYDEETAGIREQLTSFSPSELRSLIEKISEHSSLSEKDKLGVARAAANRIFDRMPESALTLTLAARKLLGPKYDDSWAGHYLFLYAKKDPASAHRWYHENRDDVNIGKITNSTKNDITRAVAKENMRAAVDLVKTLEMDDPVEAFGSMAHAVNADNVDSFISVIRGSDVTAEQHANAVRSLSQSEMFKDFEVASEWFETAELTADERNSIVGSLTYEAMKDDPGKWLSWVSSAEASAKAQFQANGKIMDDWTRDDYVAAGEWINAQPEGELRNDSAYNYANIVTLYEPAAAAEWAETLPESENLRKLRRKIYTYYRSEDPVAAAAFAARHGLE